MSDIVERMQKDAELQRLRTEVERLREALWDIHAVCNNWDWFIWMWPIRRIKRLTRAVLEDRS